MNSCNYDGTFTFNKLSKQNPALPLVSSWNHMRRKTPLLFTENGVAMLSGALDSNLAIEVNISLIGIFTKPRSFYAVIPVYL